MRSIETFEPGDHVQLLKAPTYSISVSRMVVAWERFALCKTIVVTQNRPKIQKADASVHTWRREPHRVVGSVGSNVIYGIFVAHCRVESLGSIHDVRVDT